jgi:hypothetical protein
MSKHNQEGKSSNFLQEKSLNTSLDRYLRKAVFHDFPGKSTPLKSKHKSSLVSNTVTKKTGTLRTGTTKNSYEQTLEMYNRRDKENRSKKKRYSCSLVKECNFNPSFSNLMTTTPIEERLIHINDETNTFNSLNDSTYGARTLSVNPNKASNLINQNTAKPEQISNLHSSRRKKKLELTIQTSIDKQLLDTNNKSHSLSNLFGLSGKHIKLSKNPQSSTSALQTEIETISNVNSVKQPQQIIKTIGSQKVEKEKPQHQKKLKLKSIGKKKVEKKLNIKTDIVKFTSCEKVTQEMEESQNICQKQYEKRSQTSAGISKDEANCITENEFTSFKNKINPFQKNAESTISQKNKLKTQEMGGIFENELLAKGGRERTPLLNKMGKQIHTPSLAIGFSSAQERMLNKNKTHLSPIFRTHVPRISKTAHGYYRRHVLVKDSQTYANKSNINPTTHSNNTCNSPAPNPNNNVRNVPELTVSSLFSTNKWNYQNINTPPYQLANEYPTNPANISNDQTTISSSKFESSTLPNNQRNEPNSCVIDIKLDQSIESNYSTIVPMPPSQAPLKNDTYYGLKCKISGNVSNPINFQNRELSPIITHGTEHDKRKVFYKKDFLNYRAQSPGSENLKLLEKEKEKSEGEKSSRRKEKEKIVESKEEVNFRNEYYTANYCSNPLKEWRGQLETFPLSEICKHLPNKKSSLPIPSSASAQPTHSKQPSRIKQPPTSHYSISNVMPNSHIYNTHKSSLPHTSSSIQNLTSNPPLNHINYNHIHQNPREQTPANIVNDNKKIQVRNIVFNTIEELQNYESNSKSFLNTYRNLTQNLPDSFQNLKVLQRLERMSNNMVQVPAAFHNVQNITPAIQLQRPDTTQLDKVHKLARIQTAAHKQPYKPIYTYTSSSSSCKTPLQEIQISTPPISQTNIRSFAVKKNTLPSPNFYSLVIISFHFVYFNFNSC